METIARSVDRRVRGDRILEAWFGSHPEPFKTPPAEQAQGLIGRSFLSVHRTGKHIVCELGAAEFANRRAGKKVAQKIQAVKGDGFSRAATDVEDRPASAAEGSTQSPEAQWIVHLGMTGRLLVCDPKTAVPAHTHACLTLSSGRELRFVDPRRFGRLAYKDLRRHSAFLSPGCEPLSISPEGFATLFRHRRLPIKAALLNQSLLAGVGNIYADESLFRAGIRPRRMAGRLTRADLEQLRLALRQVLQQAIRLGGSSVSDYVNADGERGFFQVEHCVYLRTGLPCRQCGTPIRRILIAGRGTHYCPKCQH